MRKKIIVLSILLTSCAVFLPWQAKAAASANISPQEYRIEYRYRKDRGRHRGWHKGRRMYYYYYDRQDPQFERQVYYVRGRPYVRWVRFY